MINFNVGPKSRQYITVVFVIRLPFSSKALLLLSVFADFTFFQLGVHMAWLSPLLIQLKEPDQKILPHMISDGQAAWLISVSNLVGFMTFFFGGFLADALGRKYTIILRTVPRLINCLMFLIGTNIWMLMFGRAVGGISDVFCCSVSSTYASEIASKEIRGGLGTIAQIACALGSMLILSVGPFLDYMTLTILITCITVLTFIPLLFLPESPYLLYAKGRMKESAAVLTTLRNKDSIEGELTEYSLFLNSSTNMSKLALLKDCVVLKTIGKVVFLAIGAQMTGYNAVMFYLQTVLEMTNTSIRPEISSVIIGCIQVLACCVTIAFTDKVGRKPVLAWSLVGLAVGMISLGTSFKLKDEHYEIVGFLDYLPLASLILVIFCFNAGTGATIWTLCAELFDGPSRAIGVSAAVVAATFFTFLITRYSGSLSTEISPAALYWMYGTCCVVICLFTIFFIPETKGKAFSEIQKDMGRDNAVFEKNEVLDSTTESLKKLIN